MSITDLSNISFLFHIRRYSGVHTLDSIFFETSHSHAMQYQDGSRFLVI